MRTRRVEYINTETHDVEYGVSVYYKARWRYLAVDGKAFIVKTCAEVEAKRAELRKQSGAIDTARTPKEQTK